MALLDLAGRKAGMPLIDLIGEPRRHAVAPMWLLGRDTLEEDVAEAAAKVRDGFRFFKLKVATKAPDQDVATTHALRAALGPEMALCADANCGFSCEEAWRYLEATRTAKLLFLEQPLEINVAAKVAESSIASAAVIHLACALPRIAWGVSLTHMYLAEDLVRTPQSLRDGRLVLPDAPGLGVEVDERQIDRLRVA
jgi:L-alanine-DL-glutamate epimerase-like enolase superfamily enzyme